MILSAFNFVLEQPWDKAAAFIGFWIAFITLASIIGARIPKVNRWLGVSIQNLLGITDLASRLDSYIRSNEEDSKRRDNAIASLAAVVQKFVEKDTNL